MVKIPQHPDSLNVDFPDDLADIEAFPWVETADGFAGCREVPDSFESYGAAAFADHFLIDEADWDDWARENDKHKAWAFDFNPRTTHQGKSHECVCHASVRAFEMAWCSQFGEIENAIFGSPLSVYSEANPRQWGGSYMQDALNIITERGIIPEHDGVNGEGYQRDSLFRHTLHQTAGRSDSGPWVKVGNFPTGWKKTSRHLRFLEAYNINSKGAFGSALCRGWPIVNGRSGHSIPHAKLVWRDGRVHSMYVDSYHRYGYDSMRMWSAGGAYCVRTVTRPHSISRPAGDERAGSPLG